ncbi:MAG: adenylate/guanylate cyclase domain-containing protein, partial [Acidimicrobiia bacterium]
MTEVVSEPAAAADGPPADAFEPSQERRFVSVLFADLVGFTPFSEARDPEEVRDFLSGYFEKAGQIVERFGGTIDKYIGDALMAVWGAVAAEEDDAEHAVRAGMELTDLVGKLGAEAGEPEMALRVGVMTGETAVGPGGNRAGLIIGDLVNTASRLESLAEPGTVLVGEATFQVTARAIEFEPIGEQTVKGKTAPVPAYKALRLLGLRGGEGRGEVLEPPFVGRVEELRLMKDLLHATGRESRPRLLSIAGIVGVGKSRLAWEFKKYVDGLVEDVYWHEGRSPSYGEGVTFWALGEMVRRRAGIAELDDHGESTRKFSEMLEEYVPDPDERARLEPRLAGLLGLQDVPPGEKGELFSAFRTFFERVADHGTTVLVFEDLHWADTGLLDFIEELPDWSRTSPIFIVTLSRPELLERRPGWGSGRRDFASIHLGPLHVDEIGELIAGIAPGVPDAVVEQVTERSAGVPLYAVELVRMLVNDGTLAEADGAYQLIGDLSGLAVPDSLHAVIGARLDRLDPEERELLQQAAVLGQTFTVDGLAALTSTSQSELEPLLTSLVRKELLEIQRDPASPERGQYGFVQALIREVAYGRLSRQDRHGRHVATAQYIEGLADDELAAVVASHYLSAYELAPPGEDADRLADLAVTALVGAAERAAALHAHEQTLVLCRQALEVLPSEADQGSILELAVTSAAAAAEESHVQEYGERLVDWAEKGSRSDSARAAWRYGKALLEVQLPGQAVSVLEKAVGPKVDPDSDPALVSATVELARAHLLTGRPEEAASEAERGLVAAERLDMIPEITHALITRGSALGYMERRREGTALLRGGLEFALEHDLSGAELRARANLSNLASNDDPSIIQEMIPQALEKAGAIGDRSQEFFFANWWAAHSAWIADLDTALEVVREHIPTRGSALGLSFEALVAYIDALRHDPGQAVESVDRIASQAAEMDDPQSRRLINDWKALAYRSVGRPDEAAGFAIMNYETSDTPEHESLAIACEAGAWARNEEVVRRAIAHLASHRSKGRVVTGYENYAQAVLGALAGDMTGAANAFVELTDSWQTLGR